MGFGSFFKPFKKVVNTVTDTVEKVGKKALQETVDTVAGIDKNERRGEPSPAQKKAMEAQKKKAEKALAKQLAVLEKQEKRLDDQEKRRKSNASARSRARRRGSRATRLLLSPYRANASKGIPKNKSEKLSGA